MNRQMKTNSQRGFTLLEILLVLAILGTLTGMYLGPGPGGTPGGPIIYLERTQKAACMANRAAFRPKLVEFQIEYGHDPTPEDLKRMGASIPRCPEGGQYYILDGTLYCTLHNNVEPPAP